MGRRYGAFRRVFPLPEEVEDKKAMGLPVSEDMSQRRPGVEFIPVPCAPVRPSRGGEAK